MADMMQQPMMQQPAPVAAPAEEQEAPGQGQQADPKSQDAYDRVVTAAEMVIYNDPTHDAVMQMLGSGTPDVAIANTIVTILAALDQKAGGKIPRDVIVPAASEIFDVLVELGTTAKVFEPLDDQMMESAARRIMAGLTEAFEKDPSGARAYLQTIPPDQLKALGAQGGGRGGLINRGGVSPSVRQTGDQGGVGVAPTAPMGGM